MTLKKTDFPPGVIPPGALLTAVEAKRRLRLGDWAWRRMRRAGLPVVYIGNKSYILSDDLVSFFEQQKNDSSH